MSLKFSTTFKFVFFPTIFSPSSKIFFSPITTKLALLQILLSSNFTINSGPIPDGSPNKTAILFLFSDIFFFTSYVGVWLYI